MAFTFNKDVLLRANNVVDQVVESLIDQDFITGKESINNSYWPCQGCGYASDRNICILPEPIRDIECSEHAVKRVEYLKAVSFFEQSIRLLYLSCIDGLNISEEVKNVMFEEVYKNATLSHS